MTVSDETRRIIELLRHRHPAPEWATFIELAQEPVGGRRIDFFAMHTWASKNYRSIAYEIKVSRNDFKNEISEPKKRAFAESISHECLFVMPTGLVQPDEIPEGWGLMVANAGGLKVIKYGTQRTHVTLPIKFVASIARRVQDAPPDLPAVAWKVQGREVTDSDLIAIASEVLKVNIEEARRSAIYEGERKERQRAENDPLQKRMFEVLKILADLVGVQHPHRLTTELVTRWATQPSLTRGYVSERDKLIEAHRLLGELIGEKP